MHIILQIHLVVFVVKEEGGESGGVCKSVTMDNRYMRGSKCALFPVICGYMCS